MEGEEGGGVGREEMEGERLDGRNSIRDVMEMKGKFQRKKRVSG